MLSRVTVIISLILSSWTICAAEIYLPDPTDNPRDDIQIIEGRERIIYEYRVNGVLMAIKVVPRKGKPYYMVPADGKPHYESINHKKNLYPKWVILEW
jgi:hypothetical protein